MVYQDIEQVPIMTTTTANIMVAMVKMILLVLLLMLRILHYMGYHDAVMSSMKPYYMDEVRIWEWTTSGASVQECNKKSEEPNNNRKVEHILVG
jgi:hypothetical protein